MLRSVVVAAVLALTPQAAGWRASVATGVEVTERAGVVTVRTGQGGGADVWRADAQPLQGAYVARATLRKLGGRLHEGYGVLFGGRALGTDSARYSYVMIRGDGGLLVKRRDGRATTVVRDWTRSDAVRRDDARGRAENVLEVQVTATEVIVRVGGAELERIPSRELHTSGLAGLRVSHEMELEVAGFVAR
jgi:hypothetical protein